MSFDNSWCWLALAVAALWLKYVGLAITQIVYRIPRRMVLSPEDMRYQRGGSRVPEDEFLMRTHGIWRNDHETVPIFLGAAVVFSAIVEKPQLAAWLFIGFAVARYVHAAVYLAAKQPHRAIAWLSSAGITGVIILEDIRSAIAILTRN